MGGMGIVYLCHDREVNLPGTVAEAGEVVVYGCSRDHTYWQVVPRDGGLAFLPYVPDSETW
jgi:hypothetical protein